MNKFIVLVIMKALAAASPQIVQSLRQAVQEMVDRAHKTENPWDDVATELLQTIIGKPGGIVDEDETG